MAKVIRKTCLFFSALVLVMAGLAVAPVTDAEQQIAVEQKVVAGQKAAVGKPVGQQPIVVNVLPAQKTAEELATERKEREVNAQLERRLVDLAADLALYTKGLFYATVALFIATFGTIIVSLYLARQGERIRREERIRKEAGKANRLIALLKQMLTMLENIKETLFDARARALGRAPQWNEIGALQGLPQQISRLNVADFVAMQSRTNANGNVIQAADIEKHAELEHWFFKEASEGVKRVFRKYLRFGKWE